MVLGLKSEKFKSYVLFLIFLIDSNLSIRTFQNKMRI